MRDQPDILSSLVATHKSDLGMELYQNPASYARDEFHSNDAARTIRNLARLTNAAAYVSALTREDWRENCDRRLTERAVHLRSGDWYRRCLHKHFRYLGFGIWLRKERWDRPELPYTFKYMFTNKLNYSLMLKSPTIGASK